MEKNNCPMRRVEGFEYLPGGGMKGVIDGSVVLCGGLDLMRLMTVRVPYRLVGKTTVLLAVDGILNILVNVCDGLVVYEKVIRQRVMNELPFMATENIMMDAVQRGGNRQELHERLRVHAQAAANHVKAEGGENDLIQRICGDPLFQLSEAEVRGLRCKEQVEAYLASVIRPILEENRELLGERQELNV